MCVFFLSYLFLPLSPLVLWSSCHLVLSGKKSDSGLNVVEGASEEKDMDREMEDMMAKKSLRKYYMS